MEAIMSDLLQQIWDAHIIDHFFGRALLAGIGVALVAGMLGCFLVWRRLSFFGDALGHAALLGVVIGILMSINTTLSVIVMSLGMAGLLAFLQRQDRVSSDTWLAVISYGSLSLGLLVLSQFPGMRLDPTSILFGDILSVSHADLLWIAFLIPLIGIIFLLERRALLMVTIDRDLASVAGINVRRTEAILMISVAFATAIGLKSMGGLLLPALFVIPAATAAQIARTPEGMIAWSVACALFTTVVGTFGSFYINTPTGPLIVVLSVILLGTVSFFRR
jgi:zinc transport system permease protein